MRTVCNWLIWAVAIFLLEATAFSQGTTADTAAKSSAQVVFSGTIKQIGAVSFQQVPKSSTTIVVQVDSVLRKPSSIALKKGDNVTVDVKEVGNLHEGQQETFYATPWILGSGVALKEVASEAAAAAAVALEAPEAQRNQAQLAKEIQSVDAVIVGRVTSVNPINAALFAAGPSRVSEHNPDWQEAVIQVQSALKGPNTKQVVIRFPGSPDVAWANSPKFHVGQQGTFLLKADQATGLGAAMVIGKPVTTYTALKPTDVLSTADAQRIKQLLQ